MDGGGGRQAGNQVGLAGLLEQGVGHDETAEVGSAALLAAVRVGVAAPVIMP